MKVVFNLGAILLMSLINISNLNAQESKRGNNWVTGFAPVVKFEFEPTFQVDTFSTTYFTKCSSVISDTFGEYQFYCTGYYMMDKQGDIMQNGNNINCPKGTVLSNYYGGSSLFDQTSIILPKKGNTYYVFCTGMSDSAANNYLNHIKTEFDVLNYSIVDMDSNSGKGKVTIKNSILLENQHYTNCALTAVKHGNGKDWWLVKADCENNRYQTFIVKEDTILGPYYQYSNDTSVYCHWLGQIYFSQDGNKMASSVYGGKYYDTSSISYLPNEYKFIDSANIAYLPGRVDLYDFDRCTGEINFNNFYAVPFDRITYPNWDRKSGISFSPNGKLLYVSNWYTIYQIDLEDTSKTNATFISGPDTTIASFPWYSNLACAPNGKMYIGNDNGTRPYMSYIDKPNIKGLGCDFKANGLWQPYTNLRSPPNMPNYGLGPVPVGVNCWPVQNTDLSFASEELVVYPNPSHTYFYIKNKEGKKKDLYNSIGQLIILTTKDEINVSSFAKGLYYIKCEGISCKVIIE